MTHRLRRIRAPLMRYGAAVLLTTLALLLRLHLAPFLDDEAPLLVFFVPVVLSAWYGGFGPSLLAIALSVFAGAYFVLPPPYAFLADRSNLVEVGLFVLQGLLLTGLSGLIRVRTQALRIELAERQHAEAALRESEAKLRLITEQLPAHVWTTDRDLRIRSVMGSELAQLGIDQHAYLSKPLPDLLQTPDHAALAAHHHALHGVPAEYQITVRDRCFNARVEPLRDGQGQIVGCLGLALDMTERTRAEEALRRAHDELEIRVAERTAELVNINTALQAEITGRKRMEEALRESEARFRAIFEGAAIGISLTDVEGRAIERNAALQEMLGYSAEELRHMRFSEVTHPDDVQANLDLFNELMAGKRSHYQLEKRYIRKDGQVIWGRLTVSLIRDSDGTPQFSVGMVEDITEHKRVAADLVKAQRRLMEIQEAEQLALARDLHDSTVQHLLGISYQLSALQRSISAGHYPHTSGDGRLAVALDTIHREVLAAVSQLRGVISELRPAGLEELGLTAALEGYVARLEREWGPELPELALDLDQSGTALPQPVALCLFRIAQEALRNALQHAQAHHITLRLRLLTNEAMLSVCDDGCGFQVPTRLSELAQVDHFGLVGMAERVALAGGHFTIQSQPGTGTEVVVRIALSEAERNAE